LILLRRSIPTQSLAASVFVGEDVLRRDSPTHREILE
jgi:hypothetical protein